MPGWAFSQMFLFWNRHLIRMKSNCFQTLLWILFDGSFQVHNLFESSSWKVLMMNCSSLQNWIMYHFFHLLYQSSSSSSSVSVPIFAFHWFSLYQSLAATCLERYYECTTTRTCFAHSMPQLSDSSYL